MSDVVDEAEETAPLRARLHPVWMPKVGYRYSVVFQGKLLVERSRDPECDAARALLAKGITGTLTMFDGKKGKPRTVIDIEKAARLRVTEESRDGLRFRNVTPAGNPYTAEGDQDDVVQLAAKGAAHE
jgi:hypothetical protein